LSKTVILLNPYGTDVTPYVNHTSGYSQLLNGTVAATTDTVYTLPYNNNVSTTANIVSGAGLLDTKLNGTSGQILVFGYSEGCQIADYWLTNYGPTTSVSPSNVSFLLIGNANRKYGGFAYNRSVFSSVGYNGGKPDNTPFTVVDFVRQYDPIGDFPTATAIVNALVDLSYVGSDANYITGAFQSVANVLASTAYSNTMTNVLSGLALIHTGLGVAGTGYMSVTPSDPVNLSLPDGNITWVWSPTYPVPMLGTGGTFPQTDQQLRIQIEQSYTRPVQIPMPDYGNNSGWGVEPFPVAVPPAPVTGWWAELNVSCNIVVTPTVAASTGHQTGAVAITVTPSIAASANAIYGVTATETVTPSVSAQAALGYTDGAAFVITPLVSVTAGLVLPITAAITVTPAVTGAAGTLLGAGTSLSVTPTVSASMAVVGSVAQSAITATPSVSVSAKAVSSSAITATPAVSAAAALGYLSAPAITATPSVAATAHTLYTDSVATTVTPSVSVAAQLVFPVSAAITATPAVTVAGAASVALGFNAVGAGSSGASVASISWSHTATSGAEVFAFIAVVAGTGTVSSVKYGSTAMTQLTSKTDSNGNIEYLYGLASAPGGAQTVTVTPAASGIFCSGNSVSYTGVASVGTPQTVTGASGSETQSVTCTTGQMIVQGFQSAGANITTTSGGTNRSLVVEQGRSGPVGNNLSISDATASTTFTTNGTGSFNGIAVVLS
jgi:PE-PPE domain